MRLDASRHRITSAQYASGVFVDAGGDSVACDDVTPDLLRVGVEPFGRVGGNRRRLPSYH